MSNRNDSRKEGILPIVIGVAAIAVVIGVVLFFALQTKSREESGMTVDADEFSEPATEAADDGELKDYEKAGDVTLGDYSHFTEETKKEDSDDWEGLVWDDYLETCRMNTPQSEKVEEAYRDLLRQYVVFANAGGMTFDELLESYGMDETAIRELAEDTVKSRLVAKTIAFREGLSIDESTFVDYLMKVLGYEEEDRDTREVLLDDYYLNTGCRPKDDIYVEMAKELLVSRTTTA